MSIVIPKRSPKGHGVIEVDDLNDAMQELIGEAAGRINEHNVKVNTFVKSDMADDAAFRLWQAFKLDDVNPAAWPTVASFTPSFTEGWQAVPDLSLTFVSEGALLQIQVSLQLMGGVGGQTFCQFAIRVNGQVIPESILGEADLNGSAVYYVIDAPSPSFGVPRAFGSGGPAGRGGRPVVFEATIQVPAGSVTVDAVMSVESSAGLSATPDQFVAHRELIVLEAMR